MGINSHIRASLVAQSVKRLSAMQETRVPPLDQEHPLEKEMSTHSSFLPGNFMDRGAWWATIQGVTKSQTRLSDQSHTTHA